MNVRLKKGLLAIAASCLFLFALAGSASAATVSSGGGLVKYNGLPSETSTVSVKYTGIAYEFTDSTAPMTAGSGCTKAGLVVTCGIQNNVWVLTGNQDDTVSFTAATPSTTGVYVDTKDGNDNVNAGSVSGGANLYLGGGDYNFAVGGSGNDTIVANETVLAANIHGGAGNDFLYLGGAETWDPETEDGGAVAYGGLGEDQIYAWETAGATINGGLGDDVIEGSEEADHIYLSSGSETVNANGGNDFVEALPNSDGADQLNAGDGDDKLYVWPNTAGVDYDGGAGTDQYSQYYSSVTPFRVSIDNVADDGGPADRVDNVRTSVENIIAVAQYMQGSDHLVGSSGPNKISGGYGNDYIAGQGGADTLLGGTGNDWIDAVDGAVDTITCGTQTDTVQADQADSVASDCENVTRF